MDFITIVVLPFLQNHHKKTVQKLFRLCSFIHFFDVHPNRLQKSYSPMGLYTRVYSKSQRILLRNISRIKSVAPDFMPIDDNVEIRLKMSESFV